MENLTGKTLIAMPGMGDPRFERSVIVLCSHSDDGAMGLIVNKPSAEIKASDLFEQLNVRHPPGHRQIGRVHFGGPVENGRGFVLHSADYQGNSSTLPVTADIGMTATLDILEDIGEGNGPARAILALGYSGWGPGQLEAEIGRNGWLTSETDPEIVFDTDWGGKWAAALRRIGIDPSSLSSTAGRA